MNRKLQPGRSKLPYVFLGLSLVLALLALTVWIIKPGVPAAPSPLAPPPATTSAEPANQPAPPAAAGVADQDIETTPLDVLGQRLVAADPAELVNRLAAALQSGNAEAATALLGPGTIDPSIRNLLERIAAAAPEFQRTGRLREVGELEQNRRTRWVLELDEPVEGARQVVVDLVRSDEGWKIDRIDIPDTATADAGPGSLDSLGVADAFLQHVLAQRFTRARAFVDPARISDATIAGLCILFEEGDYRLRASRPLRALFSRGDTASYIAGVDVAGGGDGAQFGINLRQAPDGGQWRVTEINLDRLLADYAGRVAGGDVHYSPIVRNPQGGNTIALYFEFDDDTLNPRASRQLEIIAAVLKSDSQHKITLSGHTDALGTPGYNDELSARRARIVRDFLASAGVDATQIVTLAKGASQPRRPNVTETGEDDPDGRRANRRTEIYLDF